MIYLGQPYSHPDPAVRESRYLTACSVAATLAKAGLFVYSPIVHWHVAAQAHNLPTDFDFWMRNDLHVLSHCEILTVLCLDGWRESRGLSVEISFADHNNMPINYLMTAEAANAKDFLKRPTHPGNFEDPNSRRN